MIGLDKLDCTGWTIKIRVKYICKLSAMVKALQLQTSLFQPFPFIDRHTMEGKPMDDLLFFFFNLFAASSPNWTVEDFNIKALHALRALNPGQV